MTSQGARKRGLSIALFSAFGLAVASVAVPQPATADTSVAEATGLRANLQATLTEEELLHVDESLATTSVTQGGGSDEDSVASVPIEEDFLGLHADVISSESTSEADGNRSHAEIAGADLRLDDTEVLSAEVLRAEAVCPQGDAPSADAQVVDVRLLDQNIDADADLPLDATVPVDLDVEDVVSAEATVTLRQVETADGDSAAATALLAHVEVEAVLSDQEVVTADAGEIVLAEATCERPAGTAAAGGDATADATGDEGGDTGDTGGNDGEEHDGLPGASDELTGGPGADELSPESGPAVGGTEVTVTGERLDAAQELTIGGEEVDFTVEGDGQELTFTTPGGEPGTVDVVVTFDDDSSDTLEFTYEDEVLAAGAEAGDDGGTTAGDADTTGAGNAAAGADTGRAAAGDLPATGSGTTAIATALALLLMAAGAHLLARRDRATA